MGRFEGAATGGSGWAVVEEETSLTEAVRMPVELPQESCPDCGVGIGERHDGGCDVARCWHTGGQRVSCPCVAYGECGEDEWSGFWPGVPECQEHGWVTVDEKTRYVIWDLNRLMTECRWDRGERRWVKRG